MWQKLRDNVGVAVATAVVLGALTLLWNWASEGGLVRVLGGATAEEVSATIDQRIEAVIGRAPAPSTLVPRGAVIAFERDDLDADRCPDGWSSFKAARARMIIGAGNPSAAPGKLGFDEDGRPLPEYVRGQHGGEVAHRLTVQEMPNHTHSLAKVGGIGGTHGAAAAKDWDGSESTSATGDGKPHNNMPPFIALYFCKKD